MCPFDPLVSYLVFVSSATTLQQQNPRTSAVSGVLAVRFQSRLLSPTECARFASLPPSRDPLGYYNWVDSPSRLLSRRDRSDGRPPGPGGGRLIGPTTSAWNETQPGANIPAPTDAEAGSSLICMFVHNDKFLRFTGDDAYAFAAVRPVTGLQQHTIHMVYRLYARLCTNAPLHRTRPERHLTCVLPSGRPELPEAASCDAHPGLGPTLKPGKLHEPLSC